MRKRDKKKSAEYSKAWRRKRREEYLSNKSCVRCGATDCLEIDHINPKDKDFTIVWSFSKERLDKELEKCQILCAVCHKIKTRQDVIGVVGCGSTIGTTHLNCECSLCDLYRKERKKELSNWKTWSNKKYDSVEYLSLPKKETHYKYVYWNRRAEYWYAQVRKDGVKKTLGSFDDPKKAHAAAIKYLNS